MRKFFSCAFLVCYALVLFTSCKKEESLEIQTIDLEALAVPSVGFWNGSDASGSFLASNMKFDNQYNAVWKSWSGCSYSQKNDVVTPGYENEFSVIDPTNLKNKFALFYPPFTGDSFVQFINNQDYIIQSIDLCNSTYAWFTIKNGNGFCKKFGGIKGTDPDWFKVTIIGYNHENVKVGSKEIYLADFRSSDSTQDYLLSKWTTFDLTSIGQVNKITFVFDSSDKDPVFGINTPTYLCLDNIKYIDKQVDM
jgi:hypothetical protein